MKDICSFHLSVDVIILFITRFLRLFSYGMLSVVLILYLTEKGLDQLQIGNLFTFILIGDIVISLFLTNVADAVGRRKVLVVGSILMCYAGFMFAFVDNYLLLLFGGIIGVISPSGGEIGPFISVEQACITENIKEKVQIAAIYGWYNFFGYLSTALGALSAGHIISKSTTDYHLASIDAHRLIFILYGVFGAAKAVLYLCLSQQVETSIPSSDSEEGLLSDSSPSLINQRNLTVRIFNWFHQRFGLRRPSSRRTVIKLSALFLLDAIGGGFVMQSIAAYWFHERFQMNVETLGLILMFANLFSGLSAIVATPMVGRFGAINTMVITHIPSNIFLILIPFMQTKNSATTFLLLRHAIGQMDVPARQTFLAISVDNNERSAAAGITNLVRSVGLSISPTVVGYLLQDKTNYYLFGSPFVIGGVLKLIYDLILYYSFDTSR